MSKDDVFTVTGEVIDVAHEIFKVKLPDERIIISHISGSIRMHKIKIVVGDKVDVEISPYDFTKGRIVKRHKI